METLSSVARDWIKIVKKQGRGKRKEMTWKKKTGKPQKTSKNGREKQNKEEKEVNKEKREEKGKKKKRKEKKGNERKEKESKSTAPGANRWYNCHLCFDIVVLLLAIYSASVMSASC